MRYRRLGAGELEVSEVGLGSWIAYGYGTPHSAAETEEARRTVDRAIELGVNFFDCANIYSYGGGKELFGQGGLREAARLARAGDQARRRMPNDDKGLSREQVFKQIDASLLRLRTDYVDLYDCHRADPESPLEPTPSHRSRTRWTR
jgi:aryl-alcohol dehydrogenase-like predicted oxidoreductase